MRQVFLFLFLVVAVVSATPIEREKDKFVRDKEALTVKAYSEKDPFGPYQFGFETEDVIQRDETGEIKLLKDEDGKNEIPVVVVRGSYSYPDEFGNLIVVNYYADETGFHPEGTHIPNVPGVGIPKEYKDKEENEKRKNKN